MIEIYKQKIEKFDMDNCKILEFEKKIYKSYKKFPPKNMKNSPQKIWKFPPKNMKNSPKKYEKFPRKNMKNSSHKYEKFPRKKYEKFPKISNIFQK